MELWIGGCGTLSLYGRQELTESHWFVNMSHSSVELRPPTSERRFFFKAESHINTKAHTTTYSWHTPPGSGISSAPPPPPPPILLPPRIQIHPFYMYFSSPVNAQTNRQTPSSEEEKKATWKYNCVHSVFLNTMFISSPSSSHPEKSSLKTTKPYQLI